MVFEWSVSPLCWWGPSPGCFAAVDTEFHYPFPAYLCIIFQQIMCLVLCWWVSKDFFVPLFIKLKGLNPGRRFFSCRFPFLILEWDIPGQFLHENLLAKTRGSFFFLTQLFIWLLYNCSSLLFVGSTALECVALSDDFRDRWWSLCLSAHTHWPVPPSHALKFCVLPCCVLGSHVSAVADK